MGLYDFVDLCEGTVEVTFLEYPCCCFLISACRSAVVTDKDEPLTNLGAVLNKVLEIIGNAPHNVCLLNRPVDLYDDDDDDGDGEGVEEIQMDADTTPQLDSDVAVDIYVFVRSRERSVSVAPSLKMGASEMMGLFHAQSEEEMRGLCPVPRNEEDASNEAHDHAHDHSHEKTHETKMQTALEEISYEPRFDLWESVKERLVKDFGN